jgi:Lrp/AsnC family transcriptional regulator, leucine-responsive regulatory protein
MIDEISLKILKILQEKARIPNVEIARKVGMAPSAVLERIRKLEKQGIIDGYEVILNPERFRRSLIAFVFVMTNRPEHELNIGKSLAEISEVQEVHFIAGNDCFLIKVRAADTNELDDILKNKILVIKNIFSTKTNIVLSTEKETSRIPLDIAVLDHAK